MAKVRVYELAKELGLESKDLLNTLNEMGEFVRSASSTIEAPVVRRITEKVKAAQAGPAAPTEAPAPAPAQTPAPRPAAAKPSAPAAPVTPAAEAPVSTPAAPAVPEAAAPTAPP